MNYRELLIHNCDQLSDSRVTMRKKAADAIKELFVVFLLQMQCPKRSREEEINYSA